MSFRLFTRSLLMAAAVAALALQTSLAVADTVTFELDYEFSGGEQPSGTAPWLRAVFEDVGANQVTLTLESLLNSGREFVSEWDFNFSPDTSVGGLAITHQSGVQADSVSTGTNAFKADGDGWFDIQFLFPQSGDRFTQGSTSVYQISGSGINAQSFNHTSAPGGGNGTYYSAAHVQGIGPGARLSGWIGAAGSVVDEDEPIGGGAAVPEPSSMALLGMGCLSMLGVGWRRKARAV